MLSCFYLLFHLVFRLVEVNDHADKLACLHHGDQAEAEHQRKIRNGHRDAETRRGLADRRLLEHHGEARLGHDRGKRDHNDLGDDDDHLLDLALELVHNALDGDLRAVTQAELRAEQDHVGHGILCRLFKAGDRDLKDIAVDHLAENGDDHDDKRDHDDPFLQALQCVQYFFHV